MQTVGANRVRQGGKKIWREQRVETMVRRRNRESGRERGNGMQENLMALGIQCLLLRKCQLNLSDLLSFLK